MNPPTSFFQFRQTAIERLSRADVDAPRLVAEVVLAHALEISRTQLLTRPDNPLTSDQLARAQRDLDRLERGEPLAYIVGHREFYDVDLLTDACHSFTEHLLAGLTVNRAQIKKHLDNSLMLVTALTPRIGYENAATIAHTAHVEGTTLREASEKLGHLKGEEFDELVRPEKMTHP